MKCLSVSQPFADLVVSGRKTIELRRWNTRFRGEFLVHAPLKISTKDCKRLGIKERPITGGIVGKAEIYDVKKYESAKEVRADQRLHLASKFKDCTFGFMLKNQRPFRVLIPYKGKLGFFEVDIPKTKIRDSEIITDIIDEEYRYQWIGHH